MNSQSNLWAGHATAATKVTPTHVIITYFTWLPASYSSPVIQESVDHSLEVFAFLEKFVAGGIQVILRPFSHPGSRELVNSNIKDHVITNVTYNERGIQMAVGKPTNIFWKIGENAEKPPTAKVKGEVEY